ncbi:putative CDK5 regulatory subunit-associated protein, partial [Ixodes scapularis]
KTHAHRRLEDDVPLEVKKRRVAEVLAVFRRRVKQLHDKQVGSLQLVLVEGVSRRSAADLAGRNDNNTKVIFPQSLIPESSGSTVRREVQPGDYVVVEINDCTSQVLKGTPIHISSLQEHSQKKERLKSVQS